MELGSFSLNVTLLGAALLLTTYGAFAPRAVRVLLNKPIPQT